MDNSNLVLTAWSYGLVGVAYSAFALRLLQLGYMRFVREWSKTTVFAAVTFSALWGWFELALLLTGKPLFWLFGGLSDLLRYGFWCALLLVLLRPIRVDATTPPGMSWMAPVTVVVMAFGLMANSFAALNITVWGDASRLLLFSSMASPVLAMVLLEQVFRNVEEDSRWSIKPLGLGLAGVFLFDLYLFSEAVLFNRLDGDDRRA